MKFMNMRWRYATVSNDGGGEGGSGGGGAGGAGGGAGGGDWRDALPESVRGWDEFKSADTAEAGFERIEHMRTKFGTGLFAPGDEASADDWGKFYGKLSDKTNGKVMPRPDKDDVEGMNALYTTLGRPEDAAGYEFAEGTDAATAAAIGKLALSNNLSVAQMKAMDEGMGAILAQTVADQAAEMQVGINELKGTWGAAWDERSKIAEKVRATFLGFIPTEGMNASTMEALYAVGAAMGGEGANLLGQQGNNDMEPTTLEAQDRIAELTSAMDQARKDGNRDELRRLTERRRVYYKKAYPGGEVQVGGQRR